MHDVSVFGLSLSLLALVFPALLLGLWMIYSLTRTWLYTPSLLRVHIWSTGLLALVIFLLILIGILASPLIADQHLLLGNLLQWTSLAFVFSQCLFFVNLGMGIWKHVGKTMPR
jgi:hypothetical protein